MSDFDLLTDPADPIRTRWTPSPAVRLPLNGVVVEIERFALTANNLTYAKLGEPFGYWRYFPAPRGWGRVPVWGVARVVQSSAKGLSEGERVYGFLPISTRCALAPALRGPFGFVDTAPHRADLPPTYNEYRLIDRDPNFNRADEDAFLALRPLFSLGFFLAEWLAENEFLGARRVVVSSASSKAAAALAHQLGARVEKLGLTSDRNLAAVADAGLFEKAIAYSAIAEDPGLMERPAVFVDIAGDPAVADCLRRKMGPALVRTVGVGATRSDGAQFQTAGTGASERDTEFFFAPTHILRLREQWGAAALRERLASGWAHFLGTVGERLTFQTYSGRAAIARAYEQVARGAAPAHAIAILTAPNLE